MEKKIEKIEIKKADPKDGIVQTTLKFPIDDYDILKILKDSDEVVEDNINALVIRIVHEYIRNNLSIVKRAQRKTSKLINKYE